MGNIRSTNAGLTFVGNDFHLTSFSVIACYPCTSASHNIKTNLITMECICAETSFQIKKATAFK